MVDVVKPGARILDATAENQSIWKIKESPFILWIDIEPELEIKPDILMNNEKTSFPDNYFHTIFFDPPHGWGKELGKSWMSIRNKEDKKLYPWGQPSGTVYYGWDKYSSKTALISHIHRAQKEFYRILQDNGILWFKWDECEIPLNNLEVFFRDWIIMMKIQIGANPMMGNNPKESISKSWWVLLMKREKTVNQTELK